MLKRSLSCVFALLFVAPAVVLADQSPTYFVPLSPAETAFVASIQSDLMKRFPTAKDAEKAVTVFDMPSIWDLIVWGKPNPNGAFAEKNPLLTP